MLHFADGVRNLKTAYELKRLMKRRDTVAEFTELKSDFAKLNAEILLNGLFFKTVKKVDK